MHTGIPVHGSVVAQALEASGARYLEPLEVYASLPEAVDRFP